MSEFPDPQPGANDLRPLVQWLVNQVMNAFLAVSATFFVAAFVFVAIPDDYGSVIAVCLTLAVACLAGAGMAAITRDSARLKPLEP